MVRPQGRYRWQHGEEIQARCLTSLKMDSFLPQSESSESQSGGVWCNGRGRMQPGASFRAASWLQVHPSMYHIGRQSRDERILY